MLITSQSLLKGGARFSTTRWQCVHRQVFRPNKSSGKPPPFPFLYFSQYFPGDDPALIPGNWEFIRRILFSRLRQTIIRYMRENRTHFETRCNLSLSAMPVCACTCINIFKWFHTDMYAQLLQSEAGFIHVLKPNLVGKC